MELRDPDVVVYRRGLIAALFALDIFAGLWLLGQTFLVGLSNWGRYSQLVLVRDVPLYWVNVAALALITVGLVCGVRAEYRDGHPFLAGIVLAALSLVPLFLGVVQLAVTL